MNKELLTRADELWSRTDKADRFGTKFNTYPFDEGKRLVTDFHRLSEEINSVSSPKTEEEVHSNELKRRLYGEAVRLDHAISGHYYTFEDVISLYGIDKAQDIDELRGWLEENREVALETIDKVYGATHALDLRLPVPGDIPTFRRQAEEFAGTHIGNYHKKLAKLFEGLTPVGNFLRDITAVPTTSERSYFHPLTRTLALEIPGICYITEDQTLHINEATLLELFGHEGMGHGLNNVVTSSSNLPNFLKRSVSESTRATVESVAQHYEEIIFDDLKNSPETQKELGIAHRFDEIYANQKDTQLIKQYQRRLFHYAVSILADPNLPNISRADSRDDAITERVKAITPVALFPGYAINIVEGNIQNFDSQGNLSFSLTREMVYAARPAQRVVSEMQAVGIDYEGESRGRIDALLLTGYWTPIGLVENARINYAK